MSKKLFVGGLSWDTSDQGLSAAFTKFGQVSEAKVITDRDTGRSRGFGFVTFVDGEAGDAAIAAMNGAFLDNRTIKVNEALERSNDRGGRFDRGGDRGGEGGGGGGRFERGGNGGTRW